MATKTLVWDLPVRVFHWSLAASFAAAYALAESERLRNIHIWLGYTVLGLIAFRLLWGFIGGRHARFASFRYGPLAALRYLKEAATGRPRHYMGHNPAGAWAVYAILLLGLATGMTGYLNFNEIGGDGLEDIHGALANAWLAIVVLHVLGVVFSSLVHRENLARTMVTGYKQGETPASVPVAARGVGVALATAVLGFWGWNLLSGGPVATADASAAAHHEGERVFRAGEENGED